MGITGRTRKILWTRAANRCAICKQKLTVDPQHAEDREMVLGSECHIIARNVDGPRGGAFALSNLDDYSNLILLCPSDHRRVDEQPRAYPAERLCEIKRDHELWVDDALNWRSTLPEALWVRVKQEAESLILAESGADTGAAELLEGLGAFAQITAEFLGAPELVLFIRSAGGELAFAYRYTRGTVHFAHASIDGFPGGFTAFFKAPAREDHVDTLEADGDDMGLGPFHDAASSLRDVSKRIGATESVMYIRGEKAVPEFGFRYGPGTVEVAAGPPKTFSTAFRSFATGSPVDVSRAIQLRMFVSDQADAFERDPLRCYGAMVSNLVAQHVCDGVAPILRAFPDRKVNRIRLHDAVRDRCFEGLLMLEVAQSLPDDPRIHEWGRTHADPEAQGGLGAVLPRACSNALTEHLAKLELGELEDELTERAIDCAYEVIDLVIQAADGEEPPLLEKLVSDLAFSWTDPVAKPQIEELLDLATRG